MLSVTGAVVLFDIKSAILESIFDSWFVNPIFLVVNVYITFQYAQNEEIFFPRSMLLKKESIVLRPLLIFLYNLVTSFLTIRVISTTYDGNIFNSIINIILGLIFTISIFKDELADSLGCTRDQSLRNAGLDYTLSLLVISHGLDEFNYATNQHFNKCINFPNKGAQCFCHNNQIECYRCDISFFNDL